jgi:hypothetical protein
LNLLGESFASGRYGYIGGGALDDEDDVIGDLINDQDHDQETLDPAFRTSISGTPTPSTAFSNTQLDEEQDDISEESQSRRGKRARESGPAPLRKKIKSSGVSTMEKIGEGILAMADAIGQPQESQELVRTTLQGQAQEKIQEDHRLTEEGQLLMIERFTDITVARTYLALKTKSLQLKFFKRQLQGEDGELFINWEE